MDEALLIADWQRRLIALTDNPEYVFRDTPQQLIEEHYNRLTTFAGYTESEITSAEFSLGVRFPVVFREYLSGMAKSPGDLFRGSNIAGIAELPKFRAEAIELIAETELHLPLPPEAVVFLSHQGYDFFYLLADGEFDGPIMQLTEMEGMPQQMAATFASFVEAELQAMERNNSTIREQGGFYLTLHPDGGTTQSHPAMDGGERPLDQFPAGGDSGGSTDIKIKE